MSLARAARSDDAMRFLLSYVSCICKHVSGNPACCLQAQLLGAAPYPGERKTPVFFVGGYADPCKRQVQGPYDGKSHLIFEMIAAHRIL